MFEKTIRIKIPAMSVNKSYSMKKIRSDDYDGYERALHLLLPNIRGFPTKSRFRIDYSFGFKTDGSDVDNPIKPLQDIISKHYGFNDNQIIYITSRKYIVPKGSEFLQVKITELEEDFPLFLDKQAINTLFQ